MTATQEQLAALAALVSAQTCNRADAFPTLDTAAGDDVFLAPTMRWAQKQGLVPYVKGREPEHSTDFAAGLRYDITFTSNGDTATLALLRACQAAGVEEICEIFGRSE